MDRTLTLDTCRAYWKHAISMESIIYVVTAYMEEQKVKADTAQKFVQTIISHPLECGTMLMDCLTISLQYFEKKFGIYKLYDKDKKLIAIY